MHGPTWTFWANLTPFSLVRAQVEGKMVNDVVMLMLREQAGLSSPGR